MKSIFIICMISSVIFAQEEYKQGKIDTHGGQFDNYNSIGGYKGGGFRKEAITRPSFLDKNSSKKLKSNQKKG